MDNIRNTIHNLIEAIIAGRARGLSKGLTIVLSLIVVFTTTSMLVVPVVSLDAKTAAEKGGIDVPESAPASDDTDEPVLNDASPETQSTEEKGFVYKGEGCTIVVDDSRAPLVGGYTAFCNRDRQRNRP